MQGFILEVSITRTGDELDTDHLTGDTVLQLTDASDFTDAEDPVTEVEVDVELYAVLAVDPVANTVTIPAPGLTADYDAGTQVYTLPATREKWALVEVNGYDEPVSALIGGDLYDKITDGVRDPEGQEPVVLELQNGDWTVVNLIGEEPSLDGEFLDPETVPTNPAVDDALVELRSDVNNNTGQLVDVLGDDTQSGRLQNVEETATQARNLANTADGRVSMSDYEPLPEDVEYVATDADGNPILDSEGNQVLLQRNEGSIWFTRTRARVNLVVNPSFETNTTGWATSNLTQSRVLDADAIVGSYAVELVTNTSDVEHTYAYDNGGVRTPVVGGAIYTGSIFAKLMAGVGAGCFARLQWYDAGGTPLSSSDGAATTLPADPDWTRAWVTAEAPVTAATATLLFVSPNESSTMRVDGGMLELSNILGRYFDGTLYDARWGEDGLGTAHAVESHMEGGKVTKVFELDDGSWVEKLFMGDTLVNLDASQITFGYMDGERILDRSIPIDKIAGVPATALEDLTGGELVHISNEGGQFRARKASATLGLEAHGFVLESAALGAVAYVYSHGYNPLLFDLEPGTQFLSTEAGAVSSTPPQDVGTMVQRVGSAVGDSVLNFVQGDPIFIT
jgi:hypothetical protein